MDQRGGDAPGQQVAEKGDRETERPQNRWVAHGDWHEELGRALRP
jgi:hypothetical protein